MLLIKNYYVIVRFILIFIAILTITNPIYGQTGYKNEIALRCLIDSTQYTILNQNGVAYLHKAPATKPFIINNSSSQLNHEAEYIRISKDVFKKIELNIDTIKSCPNWYHDNSDASFALVIPIRIREYVSNVENIPNKYLTTLKSYITDVKNSDAIKDIIGVLQNIDKDYVNYEKFVFEPSILTTDTTSTVTSIPKIDFSGGAFGSFNMLGRQVLFNSIPFYYTFELNDEEYNKALELLNKIHYIYYSNTTISKYVKIMSQEQVVESLLINGKQVLTLSGTLSDNKNLVYTEPDTMILKPFRDFVSFILLLCDTYVVKPEKTLPIYNAVSKDRSLYYEWPID